MIGKLVCRLCASSPTQPNRQPCCSMSTPHVDAHLTQAIADLLVDLIDGDT
jgi:hypothetical protein